MSGGMEEAHKMMQTECEKPKHYTRFKIEPLDFIEQNNLGFNEGNIIKYVCRAPYKEDVLKDLNKARVYLNRLISLYETKVR